MLRRHVRSAVVVVVALAAGLAVVSAAGGGDAQPLAIDTARVTIAGTSNIHEYTASTSTVRVVRVGLPAVVSGAAFWDSVSKPGGLDAFEVAIPAAQLTSPKEGLDKNMHKALKVQEFPDITFRLTALEAGATASSPKARGVLRIAGVERDVTLNLTTEQHDATLTVKGRLDLLMTDYGIKPPTAMLGMLKTDPKVTVTFETVLAIRAT